MDTLPKAVTPEIRAFCATITGGEPIFVPSRPQPDAVISFCFDNVARQISAMGGTVVPGWAVWNLAGAYFEAEHHGVWRSPSGELVDVSPQPNCAVRILFLPDPAVPYDPLSFRSNIIAAEPGSPDGPAIVALAKRRNQILDSYRAPGVTVPNLSFGHQLEVAGIMLQLGLLFEGRDSAATPRACAPDGGR
jgi:hypothetical protein